MIKAYILESNSSITINDVLIGNNTIYDFIVVEDGNCNLEFKIYLTDDVKKINDKWLKTLEERIAEDDKP